MSDNPRLSRRSFALRAGAAGVGLVWAGRRLFARQSPADQPPPDPSRMFARIADPTIRAGMEAAILKNMIPVAVETDYPGYFWISADGRAYGNATWPGLDSWQMAGAYLLMGRTRMVLDYFDFVRASQRNDGHIPFAIFPGDTPAGGCLSGLNTPHDIYTYKPPKRDGLPLSSQQPRAWIGLFKHWHPKDPLGVLAPVCYVLTAAEIFDTAGSATWLRKRLPSLAAAAKYVLGRKDKNGLIGGAGFYTELPARYNWDGVTQCYAIHAFRELARLFRAAGDATSHAVWSVQADKLTETFHTAFWRGDHFGEYVHPIRGLVDLHGLSDVNWAAVAFGVVGGRKLQSLWPRLTGEKGFWWGGMPTQTVSRPRSYEKWEHDEPLPVSAAQLHDVAAMGRVWYLEAAACERMKAHRRLVESARKVSLAAKSDGYWRERYHAQADGTVAPGGVEKYCEYAAILTRVVLGNRSLFFH